jgi:preprotein translocase subunit SecF
MFAALALLIWGGDTLRSFAFTIFWGVIVGTYSSIYVSTTLLMLFDLRASQDEQVINPFGNA